MCPCNGMNEKDFLCMFEDIKDSCGIELKAGIGIGKTAEDASNLADIGLEVIREGKTDSQVYTLKQEIDEQKNVPYNYMCPI